MADVVVMAEQRLRSVAAAVAALLGRMATGRRGLIILALRVGPEAVAQTAARLALPARTLPVVLVETIGLVLAAVHRIVVRALLAAAAAEQLVFQPGRALVALVALILSKTARMAPLVVPVRPVARTPEIQAQAKPEHFMVAEPVAPA